MFKKINLIDLHPEDSIVHPAFSARDMGAPVPKYEIPEIGMASESASRLVHDELALETVPRFNLASFVTAWMEPEAGQLMAQAFDKNMADKDAYPQIAELEKRCINILARLWKSPEDEEAMGCSTVGSSEAAMLAGLALKWKWRDRMQPEGTSDRRPNLVMGANVQRCWEKFCRYWEVEPRFVNCEGDRFTLSPEDAINRCDENTIGVITVMGSTFDGRYEPVRKVSEALDKLQAQTGLDIPIHVDAASGGFVAPFLQPELEWDFRVSRVRSINASGHKFGLVYPSIGWILWRDKDDLPEELIFGSACLGGSLPDFSLGFSRPGNQVIAQYYNFLRLGRAGYTRIHQAGRDLALYLSERIAALGDFEIIGNGSDIPVCCWKLREQTNFTLFDMTERLRQEGWLVPAYTMPPTRQDLVVQRVVLKEGFNRDMADLLINDIRRALEHFRNQPGNTPTEKGSHFHH